MAVAMTVDIDQAIREENERVRRGDETLEREIIADLITLAVEHDQACIDIELEMFRRTGNGGHSDVAIPLTFTLEDRNRMEDLILDHRRACAGVAAAITPSAKAMARSIVLATQLLEPRKHLGILSRTGPDAAELMRPMFEAGGIADRYVAPGLSGRLVTAHADTA
jgi:hypothetical protein